MRETGCSPGLGGMQKRRVLPSPLGVQHPPPLCLCPFMLQTTRNGLQ